MTASPPRYVIGVDVGGTFTDVFALDETTGAVLTAKVPTTRADPAEGFVAGLRACVPDFSQIATIVHGTTVGTNALLERKGAKTGIIATKGFADVLEMRRRDRPTTWGLDGAFEPVVPRDLRLEAPERTLASGVVERQTDVLAVLEAAQILIAKGCRSVAVTFVNAYANPSNERLAAEALRAIWPNPHVTSAVELLPEIREFERFSTAALNAYLQPVVADYLTTLQKAFAAGGGRGDILIVQSNGGVMAVETAKRFPVRTALSGPAAGVIAATRIAEAAGFPNVITCDMGGTSFDVSLIADGRTALAAEASVDFGLVIRQPIIEIATIGAGGGSIAWLDKGGLLRIGPDSAGSDPGPVCYGRGNERPTVTDANLLLGRINPERPIGGALTRLDVQAAERAIWVHVGEPLGLTAVAAAEAIVRVANARMAGAIRLVSIERGHDPKRFAALPFGGGGALHAGALIKDVGLSAALIPRYPGVASALGCVVADMRIDSVRTVNKVLDDVDPSELARELEDEALAGEAALKRTGIVLERIDKVFELDMLYVGQTHSVSAALDGLLTRETIAAAFKTAYEAAFGRALTGMAVKIVNRRVATIGRRPKFDLSALAPSGTKSVEESRIGVRRVYADGEWREAAVYDRLALPVGAVIEGPAILEQPDTTVFIDPGLEGRVDRLGNLILVRRG